MKKALATIRAHAYRQAGFTLIELLVVVAIISLLTGIILTSLTGSKAKSRDAERVSDLGQIQLALELYFDRCHQYPLSLLTTAHDGCPVDVNSNPLVTLGSYISVIPTPPAGASQPAYDYAVNNATTPTDYILHAKLESSNNAQQNSLPESLVGTGGADYTWASSINCYSTTNTTDYCVGPK
jgi:prepilin-type N-terminal cleavage/methylation domain-containing protein